MIGSIIKEVRLEKNIKLTDLASKANISKAYLSQIENNKKDPSIETLEKISDALNVPTYIFYFKTSFEADIKDKNQKKKVSELYEQMLSLAKKLYPDTIE